MANFVSPGVYVIEKDISDYLPSINPTVVGIVGFATRGPGNKATLVTSTNQLKSTFGEPKETLAGQGLEGALEVLQEANQVYYVRALDPDTAEDAHTVMRFGACPAIGVSASDFGITSSLWLKVTLQDNDGATPNEYLVPKSFAIVEGTEVGGAAVAYQHQAMAAVIGGELTAAKLGSYLKTQDPTVTPSIGNYIVANYAGSGANLSVSAYHDQDYTTPARVLFALDGSGNASAMNADGSYIHPPSEDAPADGVADYYNNALVSNITIQGYTFADASSVSGLGYKVESLHPGTGYNTTVNSDGTVFGVQAGVTPLGSRNTIFNVFTEGSQEEQFEISLVGSGLYIEDQINTGDTESVNGNLSQYIKGNLYADNTIFSDQALPFYQSDLSYLGAGKWVAGNGGEGEGRWFDRPFYPRFVKPIQGVRNMFDGADGDGEGNTNREEAALVGQTAPYRTGMQALDDDLAPITIAIVPGITSQTVQNSLIELAETKGNFLAVLGTPIGIGLPQDAIEWANGNSPYRTAAFNSSYAAVYYPAVKKMQPEFAKDMWFDPAIFGVKVMARTDNVADVWFAPAGMSRGKLAVLDTEVDLNQGDRDSLYSGGNCINPIANFTPDGIVVFGQRTTQRQPTALDRINVRRLMIYVKRVLEAGTKRFAFEPNDPITQDRIVQLLTPTFEDIQRRRGITQFRVICDASVNTPERVDRNELWCKVLIKPTKAAEIIVFELNVTNQATSIG